MSRLRPAQPYDWKQLFDVAGLDMTQFHPAQPQWTSLGTSDQRAAWTGVWPGTSEPLRVEAAAFHGKPVFFQLISEWDKPDNALVARIAARRRQKCCW